MKKGFNAFAKGIAADQPSQPGSELLDMDKFSAYPMGNLRINRSGGNENKKTNFITSQLSGAFFSIICRASGSVQNLRTGGRWFDPRVWPIFFPRINDRHCNRIHSSLTAVHCFDHGYVGKQPVACGEYCLEYWYKEFQESMDRGSGPRDITEITLKMVVSTIQSINFSIIWIAEMS